MTITNLSALELSMAIHAKEASCREVMEAFLDRIAATNDDLNAIVNLADREGLIAQALQHDELLAAGTSKGWLHGLPVAIKDLADASGFPTTSGSPILANYRPGSDDLMVERMRADGCIVIGKTNVPEFGLGSHTFNTVFGATRNAFDRSKSAGGSSGGAAVALAARMVPVADGSDLGGSLRNPGAWNNVFGFRPSPGRVPIWPSDHAFVSTLGLVGPMGRTVGDVAALLTTQSGFDRRSPLSIRTHTNFSDGLDDFIRGGSKPRIGWLGNLDGYLAFEPGILEVCTQAISRLESAGCLVDAVDLGFAPERVWHNIWMPLRQGWMPSKVVGYYEDSATRDLLSPEAQWECEGSLRLTAADLRKASAERTAFYHHMLTHHFDKYDFLALPTTQVWPFPVEERWPKSIGARTMDTYHRWMEVVTYATLAGLPVLNVPAGFNSDGLPTGIQLIGRPEADLAVLQLGRLYETLVSDLLAIRPDC